MARLLIRVRAIAGRMGLLSRPDSGPLLEAESLLETAVRSASLAGAEARLALIRFSGRVD
jgi:hypothetical protein